MPLRARGVRIDAANPAVAHVLRSHVKSGTQADEPTDGAARRTRLYRAPFLDGPEVGTFEKAMNDLYSTSQKLPKGTAFPAAPEGIFTFRLVRHAGGWLLSRARIFRR
jgi:hypothetical protein